MSRATQAAVICLIGAISHPAAAQTSGSVETVSKAVAEAYAQVQAIVTSMQRDSAERFALPIGRRYSGMVMHVDTTQMAEHFMRTLDDAYASTLKDVVALIGQRAHGVMTGIKVTIARGVSGDAQEFQGLSPYVTFRTDPAAGHGFWYQTAEAAPADDGVFRGLMLRWFSDASFDGMPANIRSWMGKAPSFQRPPGRAVSPEFYNTYRTIARANTKSSRACLEGSLPACRSLLAIEAGNDTLGSWLDAGERRDAIRRVGRYGRQYVERRFSQSGVGVYGDCVNSAIDSACDNALRVVGLRAPIGYDSRAELLMLAIARGGPDAYGRLESARANDVGEILETTAGLPLNTLLAEWRSLVMTAEPHSPAPNSRELLVSVVLCAGALAVSIGRRP